MQVTNYQKKTRFHIWPWYVSPQKRRLGADLLELCFYKPTVNITYCTHTLITIAICIGNQQDMLFFVQEGWQEMKEQSCSHDVLALILWFWAVSDSIMHHILAQTNKKIQLNQFFKSSIHRQMLVSQAPRQPQDGLALTEMSTSRLNSWPRQNTSPNKIFHSLSPPLKRIAT